MAERQLEHRPRFVPVRQGRGRPRIFPHRPVAHGDNRASRVLPVLDNPFLAIPRLLELPWQESMRSSPTRPGPCRLRAGALPFML